MNNHGYLSVAMNSQHDATISDVPTLNYKYLNARIDDF